MKKLSVILLSLLMVLSLVAVVSARDVKVQRLRIVDEVVPVGGGFAATMELENNYGSSNDFRVKMIIPELGLYASRNLDRFDFNDEASRILSLDTGNHAVPGVYMVRFVMEDDGIRRVKHREIVIY